MKRKIHMAITFILIVLLITFGYLYDLKEHHINVYDYLFQGTVSICMMNVIFYVKQFEIRKFTLGALLITIAVIFNFIDLFPINFINDNLQEFFIVLIHNTLFILGIALSIQGIIETLNTYKNSMLKLNQLAFFDPLTKLPNKNYLVKNNIIHSNLIHQKAVLFLNIDHFSLLNDNLGHNSGDQALKLIAKRLSQTIGIKDIVARLSGDEFLIVVSDIHSDEELDQYINHILKAISIPFTIQDKEINLTCSIGVSLYPVHGLHINTLIQKADIAMSYVKKDSKNNYFIYKELFKEMMNKKFELLTDLHRGIKNKELVVYFQPQANVSTGKITGLEALVRWNHPKLGMIYPNDFIPLAEESLLIKEIDLYVLEQTCYFIKEFQNKGIAVENVSINISPILLKDPMFISRIEEIIRNCEIDSSYLGFEITENMVINDKEKARTVLNKLKDLNIKINLDDFGKGYSSLTYIKEFPIDVLKIDKSFIDGIDQNHIDEKLITAIIDISKSLGIRVISEGVETNKQLDFLKNIGCDEYQGYLLSKPIDVHSLEKILVGS